jgi:hypothetical protein
MATLLKDIWDSTVSAGRDTLSDIPHAWIFLFVVIPFHLATFIIPALVATHGAERRVILDFIGFPFYCAIWFQVTYLLYRATRGLFGYPITSPFYSDEAAKTTPAWKGIQLFRFLNNSFMSFACAVYGFAITYVWLSHRLCCSFKGKEEMDIFTGIYFSLTTIATVGYGDIVPVSVLARLVVMCEILTGMFYTIFLFSVVSTFIRDRKQ